MINRPVALQSVHLKTHPRDTLYCQLHSRVSWYNIFALPSAGSFCEMFHTLFAYRTPSSVTRGFLSFFLSLSLLLSFCFHSPRRKKALYSVSRASGEASSVSRRRSIRIRIRMETQERERFWGIRLESEFWRTDGRSNGRVSKLITANCRRIAYPA